MSSFENSSSKRTQGNMVHDEDSSMASTSSFSSSSSSSSSSAAAADGDPTEIKEEEDEQDEQQEASATATASALELLQLLEQRQAQWQQTVDQMKAHAAKASQMITLNVGGQLFSTTKATLMRVEGTYFHAMLSSGVWQPDQNGAFFIDVDPKGFDRIMHFLRTGESDLSGLDEWKRKRLRHLADYFMVPMLPTWDPNTCGQHMELSECQTIATQKSGGHWPNDTVLGSMACTMFTVRLDRAGRSSNVRIGFTTKQMYNAPNGLNLHGWWYDAYDGTIRSKGQPESYCCGRMRASSELTGVYDPARQEISFELDGKSLGVAYRRVCESELYPFVKICDVGVQLTLLQ